MVLFYKYFMDKIIKDLESYGLKLQQDSQEVGVMFGYGDEIFGYVVNETQTVRIHYREHGKAPLIDSFFYDKKKFKITMDYLMEAYNSNLKYRKILKIKNICKEEIDE